MSSIYSSNLLYTLPRPLVNDKEFKILAEVIAKELARFFSAIDRVVIYPNIDELPENVLDILAKDLHIDWYDTSYSVTVKRNVVKNSIKVHKYLGTKYAVETALSDIFEDVSVAEWFEYGGAPFYFKVDINTGAGVSTDKMERVLRNVDFYRNLRSHLGEVSVEADEQQLIINTGGVAHNCISCTTLPPFSA